MRLIFASRITLYILYIVVILILLKNIMILHRTTWILLNGDYQGNYIAGYKYILLWTDPTTVPFVYMGEGQSGFISRKCPYTNCIVTADRNYLNDYTLFDAILFHGPELSNFTSDDLPMKRSTHQQYVFASIESPVNYPLCTHRFDNYFNWTWTYKLDSDVRWGYIVIRDANGTIIGPDKNMNWVKWTDMSEVSDERKQKLVGKKRPIAWFVSNCETASERERFVFNLQWFLRKYGLSVDIYGDCSYFQCPREREEDCNKMIEKDYYFYLAFENSFSEDYVTEKVLIPLQHNAVPVVYGGANYSQFLPNGSYLDAKTLGEKKLAHTINELISDHKKYAEYFKWKKYYYYHKTSANVETNEYCQMCAILNDENKMKKTSIYHNFYEWWNMQICLRS